MLEVLAGGRPVTGPVEVGGTGAWLLCRAGQGQPLPVLTWTRDNTDQQAETNTR